MNEKVLAVPRNLIEEQLKQGFFEGEGGDLMGQISGMAVFLDRPAAEKDPSHKQIIPYFAVTHGERFLAYKRLPKAGEVRLHNKYSMGFGGHINPVDGQAVPPSPGSGAASGPSGGRAGGGAETQINWIMAALIRELNEELFVPSVRTISAVGFINDDSNPVGQVHLGVAFVIELGNDRFTVNEPDMIEAQWYDAEGIEKIAPNLETWSQFLWTYLKTSRAAV